MVGGRGILARLPPDRHGNRNQPLPERRQERVGRRRSRHHARHRPWHLSFRQLFQYHQRRRMHGIGHRPDGHPRSVRHLQGIQHTRRLGTVPRRAVRRDGRHAPRSRTRIRCRDGTQPPLRLGGFGGIEICHHDQRRDAAHHDEKRRARRVRHHQGVRGL